MYIVGDWSQILACYCFVLLLKKYQNNSSDKEGSTIKDYFLKPILLM